MPREVIVIPDDTPPPSSLPSQNLRRILNPPPVMPMQQSHPQHTAFVPPIVPHLGPTTRGAKRALNQLQANSVLQDGRYVPLYPSSAAVAVTNGHPEQPAKRRRKAVQQNQPIPPPPPQPPQQQPSHPSSTYINHQPYVEESFQTRQNPPAIPPYVTAPSSSHASRVASSYGNEASSCRESFSSATSLRPPVPPSCDDKDGHYNIIPNDYLTPRYRIIKLLGQGTFGKVVECWDEHARCYVAIKIIRAVQKYRDASQIEIRVLNALREHDPVNVNRCIHLRDCFEYRNHVCMSFDLLGQSVFDFLKENRFRPFPPNHIQHFAHQLLVSVSFLHNLGLIHTDLKPENVLLVDGQYRIQGTRSKARRILHRTDIQLIDFGSATFQDEYHSSVVSTRHYRAPEIILGTGWSYPCDLWSVGCILVELYTGGALFQTHDNLEHLAMMEVVLGKISERMVRLAGRHGQKYFNGQHLEYPNADTTRASKKFVRAMRPLREIVVPNTNFGTRFLDLLHRLLAYDPAERISARDALHHEFFHVAVDEYGRDIPGAIDFSR